MLSFIHSWKTINWLTADQYEFWKNITNVDPYPNWWGYANLYSAKCQDVLRG